MTLADLQKKHASNKCRADRVLETLAKMNYCPCLLNDDFGNWALVFDGYQSVPENPGEPDELDSHFLVEKESWHPTIFEAIQYAIKTLKDE